MSVHALWYLGIFLILGTVYDCWARILPNSLTVAALVYGVLGHGLGWWTWHGGWMLLAMVPVLVSRWPMGDVKGVMILGGILGASIGVVLVGAMVIQLLLFGGYRVGWWAYPGDQPFFPYLAGLTCGTILGGIYPI